jgi:L-aspartate semialdehyde sulfurtransferase
MINKERVNIMGTKKTLSEINQKIKDGDAVIMTAEEVSRMSEEASISEIAQRVDVVTTGTFGPMCSSGAFLNFGHSAPPIRMQQITLNDVSAYAGIAAVDAYIGATEPSKTNPAYGGAHVIEELVSDRDVLLKAFSNPSDCYPRESIETYINKNDINELFLFNPRNAYQNYPVATNTSDRILHTYMGTLLPHLGNANYSTSGELSPLLNDPEMRTIGIGTRIFLCGGEGYVAWQGTQFNTGKPRNEFGIPISNGATLSVIGDLKKMNRRYLRAAFYQGYGVTLFVGIGIPIPILDEDIARRVAITNRQIDTTIHDYSQTDRPVLGKTNYAVLQSGFITIAGKKIKTSPLSSISTARSIAEELKSWIMNQQFTLTEPVQSFPDVKALNSLKVREAKTEGIALNETYENITEKIVYKRTECINCGACTGVCAGSALTIDPETNLLQVDKECCTECGMCLTSCPLSLFRKLR